MFQGAWKACLLHLGRSEEADGHVHMRVDNEVLKGATRKNSSLGLTAGNAFCIACYAIVACLDGSLTFR